MGSETEPREFQVLHSTSWRVAEADSDPDNHLPQIIPTHDLAVKIENKLLSKLVVYIYCVNI